ncbi:MAG: hypothetical protein M3Q28_06085 [Pseudomonadota bacterium]|nr:hypothetical protein [Pseudomonadota bacterium]
MTRSTPRKAGTSKEHPALRPQRQPLDDDPDFQRLQWRIERIGWATMVVIIGAALAGVFGGGGWLAQGEASDANSANSVRYARFPRYASPTTLEVNLAAASGHYQASGQVRLRVSDAYLGAMKVRTITPPPVSTALAERQQVFVFERSSLSGAATIRFELEPGSVGVQRGWVAVDDGGPVSFAHFIYP